MHALWHLQGPVGIGLFLEDKEQPEINLVKKIEASGLLSLTERLGLLSKAEKAGLTLTKASFCDRVVWHLPYQG